MIRTAFLTFSIIFIFGCSSGIVTTQEPGDQDHPSCIENRVGCDGNWTVLCQTGVWVRIKNCTLESKICSQGLCFELEDGDIDHTDRDRNDTADTEIAEVEPDLPENDTVDGDFDTELDLDSENEDTEEQELNSESEMEQGCTDGSCCKNGAPVSAGAACLSGQDVLACTDDTCDTDLSCKHTLQPGKCLIEGFCYNFNQDNPVNSCQYCASLITSTQWQNKVSGTGCTDQNDCTYNDRCDSEGHCGGNPIECTSDESICGIKKQCNGTDSCTAWYPGDVSHPDIACDDKNPCTYNDHCDGKGGCIGSTIICANDVGTCAPKRSCNGTAICTVSYPDNTTQCNDGNACTYNDYCDGHGACKGTEIVCNNDSSICGAKRECQGTNVCKETYPNLLAKCDDNNPCTQNDICNSNGKCQGTPYYCNQPGFCEKANGAVCNGDGTCSYPANTGGACEDGNPCTYADYCWNDKLCISGNTYTCNKHGTCNGDNTCSCIDGYSGSHCTVSPGFAYISAGTLFHMGSPNNELGRDNVEVQHAVGLSYNYEMAKNEVTQKEFQTALGYNPSYFSACGDSCPVEQISWFEALYYANYLSNLYHFPECYECGGTPPAVPVQCNLKSTYKKPQDCLGFRLPTEAEWEYAARSGTTTAYFNGTNQTTDCTLDSNLDKIGWYCGNSNATTHPVGQKEANAWGLYDVTGNVDEWIWDRWDGTAYSSDQVTDPIGNTGGYSRVIRGGHFASEAKNCRSAKRDLTTPIDRSKGIGFRLVRTLP